MGTSSRRRMFTKSFWQGFEWIFSLLPYLLTHPFPLQKIFIQAMLLYSMKVSNQSLLIWKPVIILFSNLILKWTYTGCPMLGTGFCFIFLFLLRIEVSLDCQQTYDSSLVWSEDQANHKLDFDPRSRLSVPINNWYIFYITSYSQSFLCQVPGQLDEQLCAVRQLQQHHRLQLNKALSGGVSVLGPIFLRWSWWIWLC